jgi:hypothetical protein
MALMTRGFLTTDELGINRDIASETLGYAAKGLANQLGREQVTAARATNAKNAADLEEQNRLRAEREAIGTAWMTPVQAMAQPASQPPEPAEPAVTPSYEQAVAEPVPAPAQIVPQNIPPQGQILTPQKIEQYAAQPNAQTAAAVQALRVEPVVQVPQMPMPQRYQAQVTAPAQSAMPAQPMPSMPAQSAMPSAVQQEVPTTVVAPAVQMPAISAPIEERQSFLRGTPEINGIKNPLADKTVSERLNAIHQLYKDGKIRANTAVQYVDALVENQNKQIDRALDLQTKFDEIQTSDLSATEKRLKVAAAVRDVEDNKYFEVYQAALTDKNAAKMVASLNGIPEADVENIDKLLLRAKRSPDYRAAQNAVLAQRKADLEARKVDANLARQEARDAAEQARIAQGDRRLDIAEGRAAAADARASRASRAAGSGSVTRPAGVMNEDGTVSAVKVDKQGNRTLDPIVAKNLIALNKQAETGRRALTQIDDLVKNKVIENAPSSLVGRAIASAQAGVGYSGDTRNARDQFEQFKNSVLGVIESPLMKGAPSEADARRALSVLGDASASPQVKREAVRNLRAAITDAVQSQDEALNQYDAETLQRLRGLGVKAAPTAPSTKPAAKTPSAVSPNVSGWKVTVSP